MEAHPFRQAWESGNSSLLTDWLAPDVILRSPVVSTPFRGKDEVTRLYELLFEELEDVVFTDELAKDSAHAFYWQAALGGREIQGTDLLHHDADWKIEEIVIMCRPLAGTAAFAQAFGPRLAGEQGRLHKIAMTALTGPLPRLLDLGDAAARRLGGMKD